MTIQTFQTKYNFKNILFCESGTKCFEYIFQNINYNDYDEVIVPITLCYSVIKEIIKAKLIPVFADINSNFQIDLEDVKNKISSRTIAIIFVNQYGYLTNYKNINFINNNGNKIIKILDNAQCGIQKLNEYFDYVVYSFNQNKPISIDNGLGLLVAKHKIDIPPIINKQKISNVLTLINDYEKLYSKRCKIANLIYKKLDIEGNFVDLYNSSFYRLVFVLEHFSRKTFGKFEDALYLFQKSLGEEICQTTIDVAPFQQQNVKRYLKKHTNCVPKQVDFANYNKLASKALYFRVNE